MMEGAVIKDYDQDLNHEKQQYYATEEIGIDEDDMSGLSCSRGRTSG